MLITDIKRVVEQISRDKGIDRGILIKALEEALRSAAKKKYGSKVDIEAQYVEETGEIEVFQFKGQPRNKDGCQYIWPNCGTVGKTGHHSKNERR